MTCVNDMVFMSIGQQSPELTSGHNCVGGHMEAVAWQQPLVMEETHGCDQGNSVQDTDRPGVDGHSSDQCTVNIQSLNDGIRWVDGVPHLPLNKTRLMRKMK